MESDTRAHLKVGEDACASGRNITSTAQPGFGRQSQGRKSSTTRFSVNDDDHQDGVEDAQHGPYDKAAVEDVEFFKKLVDTQHVDDEDGLLYQVTRVVIDGILI